MNNAMYGITYVHTFVLKRFLNHVFYMRIKLQSQCDRKEVGNLQEYCDKTSKKVENSIFDDVCFSFN